MNKKYSVICLSFVLYSNIAERNGIPEDLETILKDADINKDLSDKVLHCIWWGYEPALFHDNEDETEAIPYHSIKWHQ